MLIDRDRLRMRSVASRSGHRPEGVSIFVGGLYARRKERHRDVVTIRVDHAPATAIRRPAAVLLLNRQVGSDEIGHLARAAVDAVPSIHARLADTPV